MAKLPELCAFRIFNEPGCRCSLCAPRKSKRHKTPGARQRLMTLISVFGARCYICTNPHRYNLTVDHVVPRDAGGSNRFDNTMPACRPCNTGKSNTVSPRFAALAEMARGSARLVGRL